MNSPDAQLGNTLPKKRSALPIIVGLGVAAAALYFIVPWFATRMMLMDEQAKAKAKFEASIKPDGSNKVEITVSPKKMEETKPGSTSLDPAVFFKTLDKDDNGILEGAEIRGRVKSLMVVLDKDSDGNVSKEEFTTQVTLKAPEEFEDDE